MKNKEKPVKIVVAAEELELSYKTVYNWIADGLLEMEMPGYVLMSDLMKAKEVAEHQKSVSARMRMMGAQRDHRGRFKLL